MSASLSRFTGLDLEDDERDFYASLRINLYSDLIAQRQMAITIDEIFSLMRGLQYLIQRSKGGKGFALEFELMPVQELNKILNLESEKELILQYAELSQIQICYSCGKEKVESKTTMPNFAANWATCLLTFNQARRVRLR